MKGLRSKIKTIVENSRKIRKFIPDTSRSSLGSPTKGCVDFGDLRKLKPVDDDFGWRRGEVIDRYYIRRFLEDHAGDIKGRVLEMGDSSYTLKYGGDKVTQPDALSYCEGNPNATIVGDLTKGDNLESNAFDCVILTQTLQMIYNFKDAVATVHRILKPGGVLLMTSHGTSKMCRFLGVDDWGEYWRFTGQSCEILFGEYFGQDQVSVATHGNVLAATAFIQGISADELTEEELSYHDKNYEVLVTVRAEKSVRSGG